MPSTPSARIVQPNHWSRRLMVILHADMVGYSRLIGRDDSGTFLRLRTLRRDIIDPALAAHDGTLRSTAGDSLLVTFDSIDPAINAAIVIQRRLATHEAAQADPITFRIGINLGDAILDGDDLYGDGINVAARLQSACPPGRICVSRAIRDHTGQRDICFEPLGPLSLKNIDKPVDAFILSPHAATGPLRRLAAAIPTWRVRKAYAALAAIIPLVSLVALATRYYIDLGASRAQREQVAALAASQQGIAEAIAREKGVPLLVIAHILSRLEQSAATPLAGENEDLADLQKRLEAKADEFVALRQQLQQLTGDERKVADLGGAADAALGRGEVAIAQAKLHDAAALEVSAMNRLAEHARNRAMAAAGLFEKSARLASVTLRYRDADSDFGQAAAIVAPFDRHEQWRLELERAVMLRHQGEEFGDRDALLASTGHANTALALVSRDREPLDWGRTQHELGRTLRALGEGDFGTERLYQAVARLRSALDATPSDSASTAWTDIQARLGGALWRIGQREAGLQSLEEAISVLQSALQRRDQATDPRSWAATENLLGLALVTLGRRERGPERLEQGLAAHLAAKAELERHGRSLDWAQSANNVGVALSALASRESATARLEAAAVAYREALTVRTRERVPLLWARTMYNLATDFQRLGERADEPAWFEEAIATFRAALAERTVARTPRDHAATEHRLGDLLMIVGERQIDSARLREAVAVMQDAASEKRRDLEPLSWAAAQHDLGNALVSLGSRQTDTAALQAARIALTNALAERPRDRVPLLWAASESLLGWTLMRIGERETGTARFEEAVAAERAALEAHPVERGGPDWRLYQNRLAVALMRLGEREPDTAHLHEAISIGRTLLATGTDPAGATHVNIGLALRDVGQRENDPASLAEAAALHRAALTDTLRRRAPYLWARTDCYLAIDLMHIGLREAGAETLDQADATFTTCLSMLGGGSTELLALEAREDQTRIQAELAYRRTAQP